MSVKQLESVWLLLFLSVPVFLADGNDLGVAVVCLVLHVVQHHLLEPAQTR